MKKLLQNALFLFILSSLHPLLAQKIFLVDPGKTANTVATGVATVDAATWDNACGDLQVAIDAATSGDQIWVKAGIYNPYRLSDDGNERFSFNLKNDVQVYGHFEGTETLLSQRDLTIYETRSIIELSGIDGGDYYTMLGASNLSSNTILDGFTFTTAENVPAAAIRIEQGAPLIRNCVFEGLNAHVPAIYASNSSYSISNCIFRNNHNALLGFGCVYNDRGAPVFTNCQFLNNTGFTVNNTSTTAATFTGCVFDGNSLAFNRGGAIYNQFQANVTITGCTFTNNENLSTEEYGSAYGGAIVNLGSVCKIDNSTFTANRSTRGGAISNVFDGTVILARCTIQNNTATLGNGGGIYSESARLKVTDSYISDNTAAALGGGVYGGGEFTNTTITQNTAGTDGGGMAAGGDASNEINPRMTLNQCVVRNNTASAGNGGGIFSNGVTSKVINSYIGNNMAAAMGGGVYGGGELINSVIAENSAGTNGGGLAAGGQLYNCTVSKNTAADFAGGIVGVNTVTNSIITGNVATGLSRYADVYPGATPPTFVRSFVGVGHTGAGVNTSDPKFVNINSPLGADGLFGTTDDGLRLQSCSPAIDYGYLPSTTVNTDAGGAPRIYGGEVDAGAYEYQGSGKAAVITASGPLAFCAGGSVMLSAPEGFGTDFLWSTGNATGQTLTVTTAGSYSVAITSSSGCTVTAGPVEVVIAGDPQTPEILADGPVKFCEGGSVTLSAGRSAGSWSAKSTPINAPRSNAVAFTIGNKGYMGTGQGANGENLKDFWEYDPQTDVWTRKADFPGTARSVAAGFAIGNYGYIGTGFDGNHTKDFYQYDPATDTWTKKADFAGASRYKATGFTIGDKGYIMLGYTPAGYSNEIWAYDPVSDSWTARQTYPGIAKESATAFSIGNAGYVGAGFESGNLLKDFYKYDSSGDTWERKADFAGSARSSSVGFSIGGLGYMGTGSNTNDFWTYDPAGDVWVQKANVPGAGKNAGIGFVINGKGYLAASVGSIEFYGYDPEPSYSWSTGDTTSSIVVNTTGSYTLTTTNSAGCSAASEPAMVTVDALPAIPVLTVVQPTCANAWGSVIVPKAQDAPAGYTYALGTGTYQPENEFVNLTPGDYTIYVKNASGCISSATFTINAQPSGLETPLVSASGPLHFCEGGNVTLSAPSGHASYLWSDGQTTPSIVVSANGDFTVTISNATGCTATSKTYQVRSGYSILYVDQSVAASGDGSSWGTAFKEFREAVTAAQNFSCVSAIHVAAGTYKPTIDDSRDSTFAFYRGGLKVYGGYASGGGSRNVATNVTILSGDIGTTGAFEDNSYHVIVIAGIPAASDSLILDGFSVQHGHANGELAIFLRNGIETFPVSGGAIFAAGNAPDAGILIRNLKITDNQALEFGGGISISESPFATTGTLFENNRSAFGGAFAATNSNSSRFSNTTFRSNSASGTGGGAFAAFYTDADFVNCFFLSNTATNTTGAGGAVFAGYSPLKLSGCVLTGNSAPYSGTLAHYYDKLTIANTTFQGSNATFSNGTLGIVQAEVKVYNSIIWDSTSPSEPVIAYTGSAPEIYNSIFQGIASGNGNLNTDPLFVNRASPAGADGIFGTTDDGLRLQPCSPAINMGDNSFVSAVLTTDISGAIRTYETVDMGAYEFQGNHLAEGLLATNSEISTGYIASFTTLIYKAAGSDCKDLVKIQSMGSQPVSGNVTAKVWVDANQPTQYLKRHFEITPDDNPAISTGRVTLYATDAEFAAFNNQTPAPANLFPLSTDTEMVKASRIGNIQIEKRAGTSSDGTGNPNTYSGASKTITPDANDIIWNDSAQRWEITVEVTGFSGFFIKSQSIALPVRWVSVTAAFNIENQPVVSWKVLETNVATYSIHRSVDGRKFESIGEISGLGDGLHQYNFSDHHMLNGTVYYRISQTDLDGTTTLSRIVTLSSKETLPTVKVYPVPARDEVFLLVKSQVTTAGYAVIMSDVNGRNLKTQTLSTGDNKVDIRGLNSGIYILRTTRGEVFKIVKE